MKKENYRDNNLTTKQIKELAADEFVMLRDKDGNIINYETKLKEALELDGIDYDSLEYSVELASEDEVADMRRTIWLLSWKVLYERDMHRKTMKSMLKEVGGILRLENIGLSTVEGDNDVNVIVKDEDDEDYYDEFPLDGIIKEIKEEENDN
jgi:hypothetical protein